MSNSAENGADQHDVAEEEWVQLPIIDSLNLDPRRDLWVISLIPEDSVSRKEKELVSIATKSHEGKRIQLCLDRLQTIFGKPIARIFHGGGGNFTLYSTSNDRIELEESANGRKAVFLRAYVELADIALTAQIAFTSNRLATTS